MQPFDRGLGVLGQSPPDHRDFQYRTPLVVGALPEVVDLRMHPATPRRVFDQGQLGSCTANAFNALAQYVERKDGDPDWDRLSRLYTYYYSRLKIGTVDSDSGAIPRDVAAVLAERGSPREAFWPYDPAKFAVQPTVDDARAAQHRATAYFAIAEAGEDAMAACLAEGYPFTYGFAVYRSFWNVGSDGRWSGERGTIDGYHDVAVWGYDFSSGGLGFPEGGWIVRNSWGAEWGDHGYFYVPRGYLAAEAFDLWTIRKLTR